MMEEKKRKDNERKEKRNLENGKKLNKSWEMVREERGNGKDFWCVENTFYSFRNVYDKSFQHVFNKLFMNFVGFCCVHMESLE